MLRTKTPKQAKKAQNKKVVKKVNKVAKRSYGTEGGNNNGTYEARPQTRNKLPVTGVKLFNKQATQEFRQFVAETAEIPAETLFVMRDGEDQALVSIPNNAGYDVETIVAKLSGKQFANNTIQAHNGIFAESLGRNPDDKFTACLRILPTTKDGDNYDGPLNVPDWVVSAKLRRLVPVLSVQATPRNPAVFRVKLFDQAAFGVLRDTFEDPEQRTISVTNNGEFIPLKFTLSPWKNFPRREEGQQQQQYDQDAI